MKNDFDILITRYLGEYLPCQLEVSKHTVSSYCTTFKLFLKYCSTVENIPIKHISMSIFSDDLICRFLGWLEIERGCSNATINQRLFTIRA
ncbi:site-specific integrase, partial [bacterium]|nr:site-specific integrase [bacterium]